MTERHARVAVAAVFFLYVLAIRVYDVADTFLMLGEQTRDWAIALGGITELPLTGAPSTAGGRGFGPAYYWILWLGASVVGPFADDLPHAGGFWVALLQSVADTWLLVVLWRRVGPFLAVTMCLIVASAPFDIAISSVIWNPPVAAALIKMATAMALSLGDSPRHWQIAMTSAFAWMAVQAHLSAFVVAAPLLLALAASDRQSRPPQDRYRRAAMKTALIAAVVLVLQIPYLVALLIDPATPAGPSGAIRDIINVSAFRLDRSYLGIVNGTGEVLARQFDTWRFQIPTLAAGVITSIKWRREPIVLAVSVGGLLTATVLFANWTRGFDSYWFLTMTTAMVLAYGFAIAAIPSRLGLNVAGAVLAAAIVWLQPARIDQSKVFFKYPPYRTMRVASYQLAAQEPVLRDIRINFDGAHPTMDKYFIYRILGGRIDPAAPKRAFINADGSVSIE